MIQRDKINWQRMLDVNSPHSLREWLSYAGSFMQRLEQYGISHPTIKVLRQDWLIPENWECELLQLKQNDSALVREVCIYTNDSVWLYGRTIFPKDMLAGKQELSRLANRALGSVLFQDPEIKRGNLEFSYVEPNRLWRDFPPKHQGELCWVRRSLFSLHEHSLLLTEILMSDLAKLCMKN